MLDVAVIGLRALQYGGAVLLMGVPLFLLYSLRHGEVSVVTWARTTLIVAATVLVLGSLAALVAQTAVMAGSLSEAIKPSSIGFVITGTDLGKAHIARALAGVLALGLSLTTKPGRTLWLLAGALGAVAAASFAWTGHGASTEGAGRWLHLGADIIHMLSASVWLGALAAFVFILARRTEPDDPTIHQSLARFSGLGTVAVTLLVVSGMVNTAFLVGPPRPEAVGAAAYIALLVVKLLLFGLMAVLAADNRYRLVPALESALEKDGDRLSAVLSLRKSVVIEASAGILLLVVVAVMGTLPPPASM